MRRRRRTARRPPPSPPARATMDRGSPAAPPCTARATAASRPRAPAVPARTSFGVAQPLARFRAQLVDPATLALEPLLTPQSEPILLGEIDRLVAPLLQRDAVGVGQLFTVGHYATPPAMRTRLQA